MTIDINQYRSISVNRLILIINDQSMAKICVVIDWYLLIGWFSDHRFPSIEYPEWPTDSNRWTVFVWFSIDHRLTDTNRYQLTNFIDWYRLIAGLVFIWSISIDWIPRERKHEASRWKATIFKVTGIPEEKQQLVEEKDAENIKRYFVNHLFSGFEN